MTMQAQLQAQLLAQHYQSSKTVLSSSATGSDLPVTASAGAEFKHGYRPSSSRETVLTLYPFVRNQIEEMSFDANEILDVLDKPADDPDWWRCRNARGETGLVPRNYVRLLTATTTTTTTTTISAAATATTATATGKPVTSGTSISAVGRSSALDPYGLGPPHSGPSSGGRADGDTLRLTYALRSSTARVHMHQPWCWGAISRAECEAMLGQYSRPGEFIIRDSESHPGDLTVTINAGSKTRNFKVHVERDQYHIGQKVFGSIDDLIEHYRSHPIFKNDQEKHYLTRPFVHPGDTTTASREPSSKLAPYMSSGGVICHPVGGLQPRYP
ncbi:NCK adaptor protein [Fasciolopsis buskii]|uniref:NCK adaptor protein n=1 Tax=Fasciolopsis buskii TaxID=27845 RepID=A0A8E0S4Q1_9TREM|nr:NCK adaptor protein [Fasciolopsis buski]